MKKNLLIAMVLMGISAKAQFFQRTYGPGTDNRLTHGFNTNAVGLGHFMVGNTFTTFGTMPLVAVRTDVSGTPNPVPNFTSTYQINDGINNLFAGRARSFEIPGGAGFGILVEIRGATDGLAYLTLDPAGNVTAIVRHFPTLPGYTVQLAHVVVNDLTNTDAIAVGTMINTNVSPPEEYPFAYSFDIATGNTINWSGYYDHFNGFSPSINVSVYDCALEPGSGLLGVVGRANTGGFTVGDDAFYMALDITTGAWIGPSVINDWASNEDLRAIHYSNAMGLFATCGSFDFFGQTDVLAMLVIPPPAPPLWGTVQQYNNTLGNPTNVTPSDIYTRTNIAGNAEFYIAGTAADGNMLRTDATVYKLDVNLNPVGQFTYGNSFPGSGVALDGYDNTGSDGLSTFADYTPSVFSPNQNFHHIKSYYSGQSGCNEDIQVPVIQFIPPPMVFPVPANTISSVISSSNVLNATRTSVALNTTLCFNLSIGGGSNARVAPDEQNGDGAAGISPNPMQQGVAAALLEVNTESAMDVDVAIYDMLGRQYYSNQFSLVSGENRLPLELSDAHMAQGTYIVKITGTDFNKNITLLVK